MTVPDPVILLAPAGVVVRETLRLLAVTGLTAVVLVCSIAAGAILAVSRTASMLTDKLIERTDP